MVPCNFNLTNCFCRVVIYLLNKARRDLKERVNKTFLISNTSKPYDFGNGIINYPWDYLLLR